MTTAAQFPRVLFVSPCAIHRGNGASVIFANLFSGWPKDCLATVHSDTQTSDEVCDRNFALGAEELSRRWPLNWLAGATGAGSADGAGTPGPAASGAPSLSRRLKQKVFGDGVPERARLSPRLVKFIDEFRPQLLLTILGSNGMLDLIELIRARWKLPLAIHVMDDWRDTVYGEGWLAPWQRGTLQRKMRDMMRVATTRIGISDDMAAHYARDYGVPFLAFHNAIDATRWQAIAQTGARAQQPVRLLYSGSILPYAQSESVVDIAEAVARLAGEGMDIRFDIHSSPHNVAPYRQRLEELGVHLHPPFPAWNDYVAALPAADILLLPVNFDPLTVSYIRYSMPTKVPEYMASGTPILAYGPTGVTQVDYARREDWGVTVTERNPDALAAAIRRLATDQALRQRLSARARQLAAERHDIARVAPAFRDAIRAAAA